MDLATFRAVYPAFATSATDTQVAYWLGVAATRLNPLRWGDLLDEGTGLFIAHRLALGLMVGVNGIGGTFGPIASKSVAGVSISYDTTGSAEEDAGAYNATMFGLQFIGLARLVGMGGIQL